MYPGELNYKKLKIKLTLFITCILYFQSIIAFGNSQNFVDPDPLELTKEASINEEVDRASHNARNAATELRKLAISEIETRRRTLIAAGNTEELNRFETLLIQGNFILEHELGTAKVTMIDEDMAVKIILNKQQFPNSSGTVFLVFDLLSLKPDQERVALLFSILEKRGLANDYEIRDILKSQEKLDAFIIEAGKRVNIEPIKIKRWLNAGSFELRQYISRLLLTSDTQAIGLNGEEIVYAMFGKKPKFMTKEYWRTWFNAVKALPTSGTIVLGLACGTVQGIATYWMAREAEIFMNSMTGGEPTWIPILAAAWSFSYGFTIATFNTIYRNIIYTGSTAVRVLKLTLFGAIFGYVYKAITDPLKLILFSEEVHIWTNLLINQYAKDDAYRIARIRDDLQLSNGKITFWIPKWVRQLFPNLMRTIGEKVELEQADFETQISYHGLWTLKMLHFIHLLPVAVLPFAIVIARCCAYGYLGYLYIKFSYQYRQVPTKEKLSQLNALKNHLTELNHSWLDVILIPAQVISSAYSSIKKLKPKEKPQRNSCLKAYQALQIEPKLPI